MSTPTQEPTTPTPTEATPTVDWQAKAAELEKKAYEAETRAAAAEAARKAWEEATSRQPQAQPQPQSTAPRLPDDWDAMTETEQLRWELDQERKAQRQDSEARMQREAEERGKLHLANLRRDCLADVPDDVRPYVLAELETVSKAPASLANGYGQDWIDTIQSLAEGKYARKNRATQSQAAKEPAAGAGSPANSFDAYLLQRWRGLSPDRADKKPSDRQMAAMREDASLKREWKDSQ